MHEIFKAMMAEHSHEYGLMAIPNESHTLTHATNGRYHQIEDSCSEIDPFNGYFA